MTFIPIFALLLTLFGETADIGAGIDPNGGPRPYRVTTLEGNGFDPHGTPRPAKFSGATANGDEGNGLDPHGGRKP